MNAITKPEQITGSHIVRALCAIMADVGSVQKRGRNDFHRYDYATAADIAHALQGLMAKHGILILQAQDAPHAIEDGILYVPYRFALLHTSGEKLTEIDGKPMVHTGAAAAKNSKGGGDDKAVNKCHTAARKYFLLALFQIPTGDYDDADADEDKGPPKQAPKQRPSPAATAPKPQQIAPPSLPVDPETGECSPHLIQVPRLADDSGPDWMAWAMTYAAALRASPNSEEFEAWINKNVAATGNCATSAPKVHKKLLLTIEEGRKHFAAPPEDTGLPEYIGQAVDLAGAG